MKVKLKGKLRNFLYQNAEWLFLIIYGATCRRNVLLWIIGISVVQLWMLSISGIISVGVCLLLGTQVGLAYLLWLSRKKVTISEWLSRNPSKIDYGTSV